MLLVFCKFSEAKVISQTAIGVWNQYTEFVEAIADLNNLVWTMELFNMTNPLQNLNKKISEPNQQK